MRNYEEWEGIFVIPVHDVSVIDGGKTALLYKNVCSGVLSVPKWRIVKSHRYPQSCGMGGYFRSYYCTRRFVLLLLYMCCVLCV